MLDSEHQISLILYFRIWNPDQLIGIDMHHWYFWAFVAMPTSPCQTTVDSYVKQFDEFPCLRENGFSFLIDASGSLFKKTKPNLKDVECNIEVLWCMLFRCLSLLFQVCFDPCFVYLFTQRWRRWKLWCELLLAADDSAPICWSLSSWTFTKSTSCGRRE